MPRRRKNNTTLSKRGKELIEKLLNDNRLHPYHKTILKSIKHDSESKNLQIPDIESFKILLHEYNYNIMDD